MKYFIRSVANDFAAPGQYASLSAGGFRFLDLVIPNVKERKAGPGKLVVWPKFDRLFTGLDRLGVIAVFHQRHAKRVPSVEKAWKFLDALSVLLYCGWQLANCQFAVRVVKELLNFRWDFFHSA